MTETSSGQDTASTAIVIAAYNAERFLAQCLDSILAQTTPAWTCVIVDDGSKDDTAGLADRYAASDPRFRVVRQPNSGASGARNTGIDAAPPSDYLMFVDADDEIVPTAIADLIAVLADRPDAVGAFGIAEYIDEFGADLGLGPIRERHSERQRNRRKIGRLTTEPVALAADVGFAEVTTHNPMWPPAVILFRRLLITSVGHFDTGLAQCEDQDYLIRAVRRGPFAFLDQQIANYRQHGSQVTQDRADFWFFSDKMRYQSYASTENSPKQRRTILRGWRLAQARRCARCAVRVVSALRRRELAMFRARSRGLVILLAQLIRNRPPAPSRDHIELAGRGL